MALDPCTTGFSEKPRPQASPWSICWGASPGCDIGSCRSRRKTTSIRMGSGTGSLRKRSLPGIDRAPNVEAKTPGGCSTAEHSETDPTRRDENMKTYIVTLVVVLIAIGGGIAPARAAEPD